MNDAPTESPESGSTSAEDWDAVDPLAADEVRELLVVLSKALRAFQLYDENNPVYQRFLSNLHEAFETVWAEVQDLTLTVSEEAFSLGEAEVYKGESRSDSLAFLFYKDGVREITFLPGLESQKTQICIP